MGKRRFVSAAVVRLPLTDDDWIEVKERLSYGEQQRLTGTAVGRAGNGGVGINFADYEIEKLLVWLVDWSLRDEDDKPVKLCRSAIEALDPETASEIDEAIAKHIEGQERGKEQSPAS